MNILSRSLRGLKQSPPIQKLRFSRWRFEQFRKNYFSKHPMNSPQFTDDQQLISLFRDGFVLSPDYWDKELIKKIHDKAFLIAERCRSDHFFPDNITIRYPEDGIYRVQSIDSLIPEMSLLTNDQLDGHC